MDTIYIDIIEFYEMMKSDYEMTRDKTIQRVYKNLMEDFRPTYEKALAYEGIS